MDSSLCFIMVLLQYMFSAAPRGLGYKFYCLVIYCYVLNMVSPAFVPRQYPFALIVQL